MSLKLLNNKRIVKLLITFLGILLVLVLPSFFSKLNNNVQNLFNSINGEVQPDSNIILIHISTSDIENLGDWPLKRSYYALLIEDLTKLGVKKIGLEIFLSENISYQSVYNDVLNNSIKKSGKVVLSSLAENISVKNKNVESSKILYPSPKKSLPNLSTGHINFLTDNGILIPNKIFVDNKFETSFSNKILDGINSEELLKVNFISSWKTFRNYSLLEFFAMFEANEKQLENFKGKIILIGVSDPLIAKTISTNFDEELPGIGLHAFALDNIINSRSINYHLVDLLRYVFFILTILLAYTFQVRTRFLLLVLFGFLVLSYLLWNIGYIQLDYMAFIFPFLLTIIVNFSYKIIENKKQLDISQSHSEKLLKSLEEKEERLNELKREFANQDKKEAENLLLKIEELENEINSIKALEEDDKQVYSSDDSTKVFEGIVYRSKKMSNIVELIKKVAPEEASILVLGESGSGKELVANAIHNLSKRKDEKFVVVNCAALPDNLLESELFGHVKGAFTDAIKDKIGRFEEADKGTLFLDEIGETSENFQVKLLRVLQTGDFQKVGSSQTQHVDVRIVAATNKDLQKLVKQREFREDLFYRLNVITIELPSLKERPEDIEIIADYFVKREHEDFSISKAVMKKLVEHEWNGNIRELESTIKRAVIFAKSDNRKLIKLKDLPPEMSKFDKNDLDNTILESLREKEFSHSSISETAKELGDFNRTVVSENFRGLFFKIYVQSNFDFENSVKEITGSDNEEINDRVRSKANKYLSNIEKDLSNYPDKSFEEIKEQFNSKYKNLPQKFHKYLDLVIQKMMKK